MGTGSYDRIVPRYQKLVADVFRILSDASGISPDMFAR